MSSLDLLTQIRKKQRELSPAFEGLPKHDPEMLYIGCIDARLDPIEDIGIPKGKALIYRNIGALVPPPHAVHEGEPPESQSVGAALEFFLSHIPAKAGKKKHIVVSGHTHCGGIGHACAHNHKSSQEGFLSRYLSLLNQAIHNIFGSSIPDKPRDEELRKVEHESVRQSINNLMQYEVVKQAIMEKKVEIHGWVIDTQSQFIEEMEKDERGRFTGKFIEMCKYQQPVAGRA